MCADVDVIQVFIVSITFADYRKQWRVGSGTIVFTGSQKDDARHHNGRDDEKDDKANDNPLGQFACNKFQANSSQNVSYI